MPKETTIAPCGLGIYEETVLAIQALETLKGFTPEKGRCVRVTVGRVQISRFHDGTVTSLSQVTDRAERQTLGDLLANYLKKTIRIKPLHDHCYCEVAE